MERDLEIPKSNKGLAVASLAFGFLAFIMPLPVGILVGKYSSEISTTVYLLLCLLPSALFALSSLMTGGTAIIQIRRNQGGAKAIAIAGLIVGNLALMFVVIFLLIMIVAGYD